MTPVIAIRDSDQGRLIVSAGPGPTNGATQSLILVDNLAFVVSVRHRTVATAVDGGRASDGVFTNIDSVVIG